MVSSPSQPPSPPLHIAMLSWFATGHITPYLKLSNNLAEKGHRISFFIPSKTQKKFNHLNLHSHLIHFIPLSIAQVDGLPLGAETMSDVFIDELPVIERAFDLTKDQVESALRHLKPDFVFYDFAYWLPGFAKDIGFKPIYFNIAGVLSSLQLVPSRVLGLPIEPPPEFYPGSSSFEPLPFQQKNVTNAIKQFEGSVPLYHRIYFSMRDSEAICFKSYREIEGPFADYLGRQYNKPVLLTGQYLSETSHTESRILEEKWATWLNGFEKGTVVYCAFGSECILKKDQFQELVLGFELTGLPFLVRLKPPSGTQTVEEALPEGFAERVKGRGVVYGGWVQQELILSHPSVGCYVGHCGFGSMWESMRSSCQLVLVPQYIDQFANTLFMTKGLKVAVEVERREEDGWFTRENVCKAVKSVMDEGSEVGEQVRTNHRKWREFLLAEGLDSSYINNLIIKLREFLI